MRVPVEWLKELVDFDWAPETLSRKLTMAGLEVTTIDEEDGDIALEVEITSNRPDWLSVIGISREIAALNRRSIRFPSVKKEEIKKVDFSLEVDGNCCRRYFGLVLDSIKIGPSVDWIARRLILSGIRPINNVVDVTNYVMLLFGQPLHAFDLSKLEGHLIRVRYAKNGEKIVTLDGIERGLLEDDIVIADKEKPVALAGIMGGENSQISDSTTSVVLESAMFPRVSIRRTRQRLGISTDASYRFERGVDPVSVEDAVWYAVRLLCDLYGARFVGGAVYDRWRQKDRKIIVPFSLCKEIASVDVEKEDQISILECLGFAVKVDCDENMIVYVPSFRTDVEGKEDIVEEIMRVYGYDRIPVTLPKIGENNLRGHRREFYRLLDWIKRACESFGFSEVVTHSLISSKQADILWGKENLLCVSNTISSDYLFLRRSPLPGLLSALRNNLSVGLGDVKVYEISMDLGRDYLCKEKMILGVIAEGRHIGDRLLATLVRELLGGKISFVREEEDRWFSYGAEIMYASQFVGKIGRIKNEILSCWGIEEEDIFYLEMDVDVLGNCYRKGKMKYSPISEYPSVVRAVSMWVDVSKVWHSDIVSVIRQSGGRFLSDVELVDVFVSKEKRISYAYRLEFRSAVRTLQEEEIDADYRRIISALENLSGVEVRKR